MELPNRATEINLEHFPPYPLPEMGADKTANTANYLLNMCEEYLRNPNEEALLPPLSQMAVFFQCSEMKTYDAILSLRRQGFDFSLEGLNNAIRIWRKY